MRVSFCFRVEDFACTSVMYIHERKLVEKEKQRENGNIFIRIFPWPGMPETNSWEEKQCTILCCAEFYRLEDLA